MIVVGGALVIATVVYLALVADLFLYLELNRKEVWREIGEPGPWKWTNWRTLKFIFLGGVLKHWADKDLRWRVIVVWVWFGVATATLIMAKSLGA